MVEYNQTPPIPRFAKKERDRMKEENEERRESISKENDSKVKGLNPLDLIVLPDVMPKIIPMFCQTLCQKLYQCFARRYAKNYTNVMPRKTTDKKTVSQSFNIVQKEA